METITFADVEALLITYLDALIAAPVGTRVPNPRPSEFVRVARTGGTRLNLVMDQPTVIVEYWADDEATAAEGAQTVRGHIHAAETFGTVPVLVVGEFAGPANLPDPMSGQSRYTATYSLTLGY